jgi:hypothetical protein
VITNWADPAIQADNPGLILPNRAIVPVVYSNGSGITAQFTAWMADQYPAFWDAYCQQVGRTVTPCGSTSFYPHDNNMVAKAQSQGAVGFVAQDSSEGSIHASIRWLRLLHHDPPAGHYTLTDRYLHPHQRHSLQSIAIPTDTGDYQVTAHLHANSPASYGITHRNGVGAE